MLDLKKIKKDRDKLTPREKREYIIKLRDEQFTYIKIADILGMHEWQVRYHLNGKNKRR